MGLAPPNGNHQTAVHQKKHCAINIGIRLYWWQLNNQMTVEWCSAMQKYELIFFSSEIYFLSPFSWWLTFIYYHFNINHCNHNSFTQYNKDCSIIIKFCHKHNVLFCHKNLHPRHQAYQKLQFYSNRHYLYHRRVPWFEIVVKAWILSVCILLVL